MSHRIDLAQIRPINLSKNFGKSMGFMNNDPAAATVSVTKIGY